MSGSLTGKISASNVNVGIPTSNNWQSSLNGSYFNNFTPQTDISEILRFVAGLLSSSAPDASPNTKIYSTYTSNVGGTGTGTALTGRIPSASSNATINYLNTKGFATSGSAIFSGITPIYNANYTYTYTSVSAGSTTVSSSVDAQLFGLGPLLSGTPTNFSVSGSFTFRFKNNSAKTDTDTSSSGQIITQTGAGTTSGVSLAKINTANPAVIPAGYQDGKYATVFSPYLYSGSASGVSASGYYHISASIAIASSSGNYSTPIASNVEIFWAPTTTISTNVPTQTPSTGSTTITALTATSRSLSGAPYLSGSTYGISSSVTGIFNPLYYASTIATVTATTVTNTSGIISVAMSAGTPSTISTVNAVFDSTGTTVRASSTIPKEDDIIKLGGAYVFAPGATNNVSQIGTGSSTFTFTVTGYNYNGSATAKSSTVSFHTAGAFGQPAASGGLAYYGAGQSTDTSTALVESFVGETYRIQATDAVLTFSGSAWNTASAFYTLGNTDLQVKPGYVVKPGGTYKYWLTNPSSTSDYKYYIRKFTTSGTKTTMTINAGQVLSDWQTSGSNSVAALVLFESSVSGSTASGTPLTTARFYDPTKTISNFVGNIPANTDGQNLFGSTIALYGNTGGSLASTTYTMPIRNADGIYVESVYNEVYVIVRYKGDPTPVSSITVAFS